MINQVYGIAGGYRNGNRNRRILIIEEIQDVIENYSRFRPAGIAGDNAFEAETEEYQTVGTVIGYGAVIG